MTVTAQNRLRHRAILIGREVKAIFQALPEVFGARRPRWLWRWLLLGHDGKPHRAGEIVLADLRGFAMLDRGSIFDPDPIVMAYRQGKRDAVMRIFNFLALDEQAVQQLMELDDGLG